MKNILVSTTFSGDCTEAVNLAIKIAKHYSAEIHFFHFIKTPVDWVKISKTRESRYPDALKQIGQAKSRLRDYEKQAEHEHLKCKTFIEFDVSPENILEHSNHFNYDFIVTVSGGTKDVVRKKTGSNVELIVRKASVPVLIVKEGRIVFPFKNMMFVSNFVKDASDALREVISIAKKHNATIHLLQIITETDFNSNKLGLNPVEQLLQRFPEFKNYSLTVYNEPSVERGINTFTKKQPVDLIAMVIHGKTGFLNLFSKSIDEGFSNHFTLPVLTMNI